MTEQLNRHLGKTFFILWEDIETIISWAIKTKLYSKGNDQNSSMFGGILSVICGITLILNAIVLLVTTLNY